MPGQEARQGTDRDRTAGNKRFGGYTEDLTLAGCGRLEKAAAAQAPAARLNRLARRPIHFVVESHCVALSLADADFRAAVTVLRATTRMTSAAPADGSAHEATKPPEQPLLAPSGRPIRQTRAARCETLRPGAHPCAGRVCPPPGHGQRTPPLFLSGSTTAALMTTGRRCEPLLLAHACVPSRMLNVGAKIYCTY